MSGFHHLLTLLTVLPLVGAAIALVAGKHARGVALITTLRRLALALVVWTQLPARSAASGSSSSTPGRLRWASSITWAWTGWAR